MYNIASLQNKEYQIGDPPVRGLASCTDAVIFFRARYVIYSIAPRVPPGSAHGDKTVASCFVVCVHRLCVSVSAALSSVSLI